MFSLSARTIPQVPSGPAYHHQYGQNPRSSHAHALVQLGSSQLVALRPCPNSDGQCLSMTLIQDDGSNDSSIFHISAQRDDRETAQGRVIRAIAGKPLSTSTGQAFALDRDGHVNQYAFGIDPSPFLSHKRKIASFSMAGLAATDPEPALVCLSFPQATGFAVAVSRTVYVWLQHVNALPGGKNPHQQRLCLEDHSSPVVAVCAIASFIVTLSADHSFKLWGIGGHNSSPTLLKCIYQSEILSAVAAPTFMTSDHTNSLYIGSSDGVVRVIHVKPIPTAPFTQVRSINSLPVAKWIMDSLDTVQNEADRAASTMCISAKGGVARRVLTREDSGVDADAAAGLSHAVLTLHVDEGRVYAVTASHLVVCSLARQQPLFIHDFRDPLDSDSCASAVGLLRAAQVPANNLVDDGKSSIAFALVPLVRKASTHSFLLDVLEAFPSAAMPDRTSPDLLSALDNLSLDEPLSYSTPLSHVLLHAITLHHGRGHGQSGSRPDKWLQSMAESTLSQLQSVHIITVGDLVHHRDIWSSPNTQLALPLGMSKMLDSLSQLGTATSLATASAIPIVVQEIRSSDLVSASPLHKHTWTNKPPAAPSKLDKHITFRTTVKSSGYSSAPTIPRHLLASHKSSKSTSSAPPPSRASDSAAASEWDLLRTHGSPRSPPGSAIVSHPAWHPGPIVSISTSCDDGRYIAVGGADGSANIVRASGLVSPKSTAPPSILSSSRVSGTVMSSCWSHDSRTVMLCSPNVVRVWEPRAIGKDPTAPGTDDPNVDLPDLAPGSIAAAQFAHKSRLALVAHKNHVELFKFQLTPDSAQVSKQQAKHLRNTFTSADLKPRLPSGRAKSVWHLSAPNSAQHITALSAWNNRSIPLAVFATSDKSLCVADLNQGVLAARVSTDSSSSSSSSLPSISANASSVVGGGAVPTSRFIHSIYTSDTSNPNASHFAPHLFLTTAHGDTVRLWDLRTMATVIRFGSHLPCARHLRVPGATGAIMSPCGTLVAVPTDMPGQAIALFDIRNAGTRMADQVGGIPVMQSQVKKQGASVGGRAIRMGSVSRPGSVLGSSARGDAGVGVPRCATMGGELVGGMAFHGERAVLVVGTTRGGLLSYRMA